MLHMPRRSPPPVVATTNVCDVDWFSRFCAGSSSTRWDTVNSTHPPSGEICAPPTDLIR